MLKTRCERIHIPILYTLAGIGWYICELFCYKSSRQSAAEAELEPSPAYFLSLFASRISPLDFPLLQLYILYISLIFLILFLRSSLIDCGVHRKNPRRFPGLWSRRCTTLPNFIVGEGDPMSPEYLCHILQRAF